MEQLGTRSGTERVQAVLEAALELVGTHEAERKHLGTSVNTLGLVSRSNGHRSPVPPSSPKES